jgi:DNA-binding response OmpR family regulator
MQNILIADDEEMIRNLINLILKQEGYSVQVARNGQEASQLLNQSVPELLITDLVMPEKSGTQLIQEVRRQHPAIPIIAISGAQADQPDIYLKMADSLGADYLLAKPFSPSILLLTVRKALGE